MCLLQEDYFQEMHQAFAASLCFLPFIQWVGGGSFSPFCIFRFLSTIPTCISTVDNFYSDDAKGTKLHATALEQVALLSKNSCS